MKFSQAQIEAYFELCKYRMKNVYLTWVEQFLDLIEDNIDTSVEFCINDIGCNLGQFYKGLRRRKFCKNVEYYGLDNSEKYLKEAKIIFSDIKSNFININICETSPPFKCNVSISSATFEHLNNYPKALTNTFQTTKNLFLLRTFLSEKYDNENLSIKGGNNYPVQQFSFHEICSIAKENNFYTEIIRDRFTDSLPSPVGNRTGENIIMRTFYICMFKPINS